LIEDQDEKEGEGGAEGTRGPEDEGWPWTIDKISSEEPSPRNTLVKIVDQMLLVNLPMYKMNCATDA
jgi:hypothetical protein